MSFGIPAGRCHTDLYTAEPPVPVLDTATGSLGPGRPQLGIGPGPSQNPSHPHSHNLAGMDSKQSSLSGSTLLQNIKADQSQRSIFASYLLLAS